MKNIIRYLQLFIGWPLLIIALLLVSYRMISYKTIIISSLEKSNIQLLIISICFFLLYFFLRSFFWHYFLRTKKVIHPYSFRESMYGWSISEIKRYIPGSIWSFLGRVYQFTHKSFTKKEILSFMASEIIFLLLGSLSISLLASNFLFYTFTPTYFHTLIWYLSVCLLISLVFITFLFYKKILPDTFLQKLKKHMILGNTVVKNIALLCIMSLAFLSFSLGSYFAIVSFVPLTSSHLFSYIGIFSFAYLIGYLAVITPMGLGVREAIVTIGLSAFIPVALATVAAIYIRVILLTSEIVFFLFSYVLYYLRKSSTKVS